LTTDKRHRNVFFSVVLFIGLCLISFIVPWDTDFAAAGLTFATEFVAIGVGLLFLFMKILKVTISRTNFFYSYFGVLNLILGLLTLGIMLFYKGFTTVLMLLTLTQLFIGLLILIDIFRRKQLTS
jgi:hypothetical protein